jgi:hypothetical protein
MTEAQAFLVRINEIWRDMIEHGFTGDTRSMTGLFGITFTDYVALTAESFQ